MSPWEDARSSRQPCYRCSGYCQLLNFVCGLGGWGGRSTLEGTDIYNIVVKYCCLNSHLSHHGLVQKAFSERLSKASLHSLYLWQAKLTMLIIQPFTRKKNRTSLQQGHVNPRWMKLYLRCEDLFLRNSISIWNTGTLSLRIYSQGGKCLRELCYQSWHPSHAPYLRWQLWRRAYSPMAAEGTTVTPTQEANHELQGSKISHLMLV